MIVLCVALLTVVIIVVVTTLDWILRSKLAHWCRRLAWLIGRKDVRLVLVAQTGVMNRHTMDLIYVVLGRRFRWIQSAETEHSLCFTRR
jgi:hypothetical protein